MSRINHAKLAHRGRQTEMAMPPRFKWDPKSKAEAATPGQSLPPEVIAAWANQHGYSVAAR